MYIYSRKFRDISHINYEAESYLRMSAPSISTFVVWDQELFWTVDEDLDWITNCLMIQIKQDLKI